MAGKPKNQSTASVAGEVEFDPLDHPVDALAQKLFIHHWRPANQPQYEIGHLAEQCFIAAEAFHAYATTRREAVASA